MGIGISLRVESVGRTQCGGGVGIAFVSGVTDRSAIYGVVLFLAVNDIGMGETDIEWYYRMEEGLPSRKPLIEA